MDGLAFIACLLLISAPLHIMVNILIGNDISREELGISMLIFCMGVICLWVLS